MNRLRQLDFVDLVCEGMDIVLKNSEATLREEVESKCTIRCLCKFSYPRVSQPWNGIRGSAEARHRRTIFPGGKWCDHDAQHEI